MTAKPAPKSQPQTVKTQIRMPDSLHSELNAAALKSGRSFNAEMIYRLSASLPLEELTTKQQQLIDAQRKESETTEKIIKDLAGMLVQAMKDQSANETNGVVAALTDVLKAPKSRRIRTAKTKR